MPGAKPFKRNPRRKIPQATINKILELNKRPFTIAQIAEMVGLPPRTVKDIISKYAGGRPKEVVREILRKSRKRAKKPTFKHRPTRVSVAYERIWMEYAKKSIKEIREKLKTTQQKLSELDRRIKESNVPIYKQPKKIIEERNKIVMSIKALEHLLRIKTERKCK